MVRNLGPSNTLQVATSAGSELGWTRNWSGPRPGWLSSFMDRAGRKADLARPIHIFPFYFCEFEADWSIRLSCSRAGPAGRLPQSSSDKETSRAGPNQASQWARKDGFDPGLVQCGLGQASPIA